MRSSHSNTHTGTHQSDTHTPTHIAVFIVPIDTLSLSHMYTLSHRETHTMKYSVVRYLYCTNTYTHTQLQGEGTYLNAK